MTDHRRALNTTSGMVLSARKIMEYVEGQTLLTSTLSKTQFKFIKKAVARLHAEPLVFRDLREPDILVPAETNHAMPIDFDKDEVATYPIDLNCISTINWRKMGQNQVRL
jgi:tRNA A-37 threonylcarbamoyl transferase component Bud32